MQFDNQNQTKVTTLKSSMIFSYEVQFIDYIRLTGDTLSENWLLFFFFLFMTAAQCYFQTHTECSYAISWIVHCF